jgi:hypothetical protein
MKSILLAMLSLAFLPGTLFSQTYTTNFDGTENPISESGSWQSGRAVGLDWADIATYSGVAHGTNNTSGYADPTAILTGTWTADQTAEATVYSVNPTNSVYQEVELRLRSSVSAHSCSGYEIFFRCLKTSEAYTQIVRWNGPLADFSYIASNTGTQYGATNGDVVKATIVGNVITAYINNVVKATATDSTFKTGNPGIGINYGCNGTYQDFGFTTFKATGAGTGREEDALQATPGRTSITRIAPSPFKWSAMIVYGLPAQTEISLKVYDMLGRETAILFSGAKPAGVYSACLDGSRLPAGVYTVRLVAGHISDTRRVLLMR